MAKHSPNSSDIMEEQTAIASLSTTIAAQSSKDGFDSLLHSMEEKRKANVKNNRKEGRPSIFRVPRDLRDVEPGAYEPKHISLGPYHHGKRHLQAIQNLKWNFLDNFLKRDCINGLERYVKEVMNHELKARSAYSEYLTMSSEEFVEMMVLDACFILELLQKTSSYKKKNIAVDLDRLINDIIHDMLNLENQVPFFLLKELLEINSPKSQLTSLVSELLCKYLKDFKPTKDHHSNNTEVHHILHLFHTLVTGMRKNSKNNEVIISMESFLTPPPPSSEESHEPLRATLPLSRQRSANNSQEKEDDYGCCVVVIEFIKFCICLCLLPFIFKAIVKALFGKKESLNKGSTVPCATRLTEAGVTFKAKKEPMYIADVTFDKDQGTIEIPKLTLDTNTHSILRNLIALEQSFPDVGTEITDYGYLMDCLIDTADDVAVLKKKQIISNFGDESNVANMINNINKNVLSDPDLSCFAGMYRDIKRHCEKRPNYWRAKLLQDYFGNPWATTSVIAAVVLILLTLLQSAFAVLAYVKPPH